MNIDRIIKKIENGINLTEKEIDFINKPEIVAVYGFTHSIGHLTSYGKNEAIKNYKDEILKELYEFKKKIKE